MSGLMYIRKLLEISNSELARKLNVSRQAVLSWEQGKKPIPNKRLKELSSYFGIPEKYFQFISDEQERDIIRLVENYKLRQTDPDNLRNNECKKELLKKIDSLIKGEIQRDDLQSYYLDVARTKTYINFFNDFVAIAGKPWLLRFLWDLVFSIKLIVSDIDDCSEDGDKDMETFKEELLDALGHGDLNRPLINRVFTEYIKHKEPELYNHDDNRSLDPEDQQKLLETIISEHREKMEKFIDNNMGGWQDT